MMSKEEKLKLYESIGTPEECAEAMQTVKGCKAHYLANINNPLAPLMIIDALKREDLKLQFNQANGPENISALDYTVIAALKEALKKRVKK